MKRILYKLVDGVPVLEKDVDYWRVKFNLSIPDNIYFNPFFHHIMGQYHFFNQGRTLTTTMTIHMGIGTIFVMDGDECLFYKEVDNFYDFHISQIEFWNIFAEPLVYHLQQTNLLTKDDLIQYCSILFYPPVGSRTDWDYSETI